MPRDHVYKCPVCEKRRLAKRAYRQTPKGFLVRRWVKMRRRLSNEYANRNLKLLTSKEFHQWAMKDTTFIEMYLTWKDAGMPLHLTPTVDRIDNRLGYVIENMQWLTFLDNTRKAGNEGKEGYKKWMKRKKK